MVEIAEFAGRVRDLPVQGLVGDGLLPPRLARMQAFFDELANRSAQEHGISQDLEAGSYLYALWGRTSEGEVLGLRRRGGSWLLTRVPVPSGIVRSLNLPGVFEAKNKLVWIEIGPKGVDILRQGERIPLWRAEIPGSRQAAMQVPRRAMPPGISLG